MNYMHINKLIKNRRKEGSNIRETLRLIPQTDIINCKIDRVKKLHTSQRAKPASHIRKGKEHMQKDNP